MATIPNLFAPERWAKAGSSGIWSQTISGNPREGRYVALAYFEPGASAGMHHHATAHMFLFLDGEADDVIVYPDGRREVCVRRKGDFVEYDYPVEHFTYSRHGCLILFEHDAKA